MRREFSKEIGPGCAASKDTNESTAASDSHAFRSDFPANQAEVRPVGRKMQSQRENTNLINSSRVRSTLKHYGLSPTRKLFHMNNTTSVLAELLRKFPVPERRANESAWDGDGWNAWEAVGLYYITEGRHYEALSIFATCYEQLLQAQAQGSFRIHKGKPLIWMSDCYWHMNWLVHAKRYFMLAFCEDLLNDASTIITHRGAFYRGIWRHGMPEIRFTSLARQVTGSPHFNPSTTMFPEELLQDIGEDWITETPDPREVGAYTINYQYARFLLDKVGEKSGRALERLAHYLLSCMPGVRTRRRLVSGTSEYDIVCSVDGLEQDFRSELGRYFICECKDWSSAADFGALAKFIRLLKGTNARLGILFSRKGLSGKNRGRYATNERLRLYLQEQVIIVVVTLEDLVDIVAGASFIEVLREKYEAVRLDLPSSH